MATFQKSLGSFLIGAYAWVLTIFFGMVLLDILYANQAPEAAGAFSTIADFLLLIGFVAFLSAMLAIVLSWRSPAARNLLIASLLLMLLEFMIPALSFQLILSMPELAIGPWLRIIPTGIASILALIGMQKYARQG